jgi:hypothetical protein
MFKIIIMRKLCLKLNNVEILHRRMGKLQGWMRYCFLANRSLLLSPCLIIIARFIQCTSVAVVVDRRERGTEGRRRGRRNRGARRGRSERGERKRQREREETGTKRQRRETEETEETCRETETERRQVKEGFEWILGAMPCLFVSIFGGVFMF